MAGQSLSPGGFGLTRGAGRDTRGEDGGRGRGGGDRGGAYRPPAPASHAGPATARSPNTSSQASRRAASASAMVAGMPSAARLVTPVLANAAGHDAGEMRQVRRHVQRHAVPTHPARDAHADRADLRLGAGGAVGHPDADPALPAFPAHAEPVEGADQPRFQPMHVAADIARRHAAVRPGEIEHHIHGALPRAVIGPLSAAPGGEGGEAGRVGQFLRPCRGSRGIKRRVLYQPHRLRRRAGADRRDALLHGGQRVGIGCQALGDAPFRRRRARVAVALRGARHRGGPAIPR